MILFSPEWDRSCAVCVKYLPRDDGSFILDKRTGEPVRRGHAGDTTPCGKCAKVPDRVKVAADGDYRKMRAGAVELSDANRLAYQYYTRCRAVGRFPEDPIVEWCAGVISEIVSEFERAPLVKLAGAVSSLVTILPIVLRVRR